MLYTLNLSVKIQYTPNLKLIPSPSLFPHLKSQFFSLLLSSLLLMSISRRPHSIIIQRKYSNIVNNRQNDVHLITYIPLSNEEFVGEYDFYEQNLKSNSLDAALKHNNEPTLHVKLHMGFCCDLIKIVPHCSMEIIMTVFLGYSITKNIP